MDPLSFGRLWPETVALVRRHADFLLPVGGAFLFLPQLLFAWHVGDADPKLLFRGERFVGDALAFAGLILVSQLGQLVIAFMAVRDGTGGSTLGELLGQGGRRLLPATAAWLMQGLAVGFGLVLFILPGLWLLARLALVLPLVATDEPDPVNALGASWRLTNGHALRILAMLSLLLVGFLLIVIGINGVGMAIGVISTVATGQPAEGWGLGRWLFETMGAAASATVGLFYTCFLGILYRTLAERAAPHG